MCGAQLRYLIHSSVIGYLGAIGFSSPAWALRKRDEYVGWTEAARTHNLQRVACNSRFLIIPTVRVPNLASHVLGQCCRRIGSDWRSRYGTEPVLLETFVDPKRFSGIRRGRIKEYADKYPSAVYTPVDASRDYNPLWNHKADCAFPAATENEINGRDAQNLVNNGVKLVCEGANMPTTPEGINIFLEHRILYGPSKVANAGGVSVSGLEMTQNSMRLNWTREEVDSRLKTIMKSIHTACLEMAARHGTPGNYMNGANIAGFVKVVEAMMDQGLV